MIRRGDTESTTPTVGGDTLGGATIGVSIWVGLEISSAGAAGMITTILEDTSATITARGNVSGIIAITTPPTGARVGVGDTIAITIAITAHGTVAATTIITSPPTGAIGAVGVIMTTTIATTARPVAVVITVITSGAAAMDGGFLSSGEMIG